MHYYQFNIADYRKDTQHLTPLEHYVYRELIDWYYLDEAPIPKETHRVLRRLRLGSQDEPSLAYVLSEFFDERKEGWFHGRVDADIQAYEAKAETARANGSKGGRPKKPKKTQPVNSGNREKSESKANQEPLTINQDNPPCESPPGGADPKWIPPPHVNLTAWAEFEQHRKEIRKPLSKLSRTKAANQLAGLTAEQQQACIDQTIQNRWQGLFPEKIYGTGKNHNGSGNISRAKRVADKLDEIARRDIAERGGITETLD